jgi:signal transduction histidine kinase
MRLSRFIMESSGRIISEWEVFARSCLPAASTMDLEQRRDHVAAMLKVIAIDLDTPQTKDEQKEKSLGNDDAPVNSNTAANAHGTDRAASGYTPVQMVSEFRALRASILRLWSEAQNEFNRANLEEITRFNEAIDQLLVESITRYAQDVDRVRDLFLGVLGHDLRNPLGAIMMAATLMMGKEGPDWLHAKTAARILSSGSRMNLLIGDLLDFTRSRLGAGIPIDPTEIDLEATCRQVVDEIAALHPRSVVRFEATGPLHGQWDGARVAQALSNLLGNAYQHGSRNAPIEVVLRGEPDQVVLTVHNQGPVIPKDRLQDIFNPLQQLNPDPARSSRGSVGLGLYIVRAIATAHAGTIDVESTEHGTTFTLRLPRSRRSTAAEAPGA